jgi:hypothetical protein
MLVAALGDGPHIGCGASYLKAIEILITLAGLSTFQHHNIIIMN